MSEDISAFFAQDDVVFELPIMGRDPETKHDVDTGVVFFVRGIKNPDSISVVKRAKNRIMGQRLQDGKDVDPENIGEVVFMETGADPSDEQLAHCVTGWDWNGKKFGKLKTDFSIENVLSVFRAAPWIKLQVQHKALAITDFT
jgi:hypothetical protein